MTVQELIDKLQEIENKELIVLFSDDGWIREVDEVIECKKEVWLDW